jgi:hypothetical protein
MSEGAEEIRDPSGRVLVRIRETGPEHFVSSLVETNGISAWQEVIAVELQKVARGELFVTATVTAFPLPDDEVQIALLETRIVAFIGSARLIVAGAALGGDAGDLLHTWQDGRTYNRIAVEVRMIVDGRPSSQPAAVSKVQAVGRFWR